MIKIATVALGATLGLAALANSQPAAAGVSIGVGVGVPGVAVAAPPVAVAPRVVVAPPAVGVAPAPIYSYPYYAPGYVGFGWGHPYWRGAPYGRWAGGHWARGYHR
jgi:hypothetical protein